MFEIGQIVVHHEYGLCKIKDIELISYVNKDYYIMYPLDNDKTKIMVPCDNASSMCRKLINKKECLEMIDSIDSLDDTFIIDNKKRKEESLKLLQSENLLDIAKLLKTLAKLFREKKAKNKTIGTIDSSIYNEAKNKLYSEIGYVLGMKTFDEVESYIMSHIHN